MHGVGRYLTGVKDIYYIVSATAESLLKKFFCLVLHNGDKQSGNYAYVRSVLEIFKEKFEPR